MSLGGQALRWPFLVHSSPGPMCVQLQGGAQALQPVSAAWRADSEGLTRDQPNHLAFGFRLNSPESSSGGSSAPQASVRVSLSQLPGEVSEGESTTTPWFSKCYPFINKYICFHTYSSLYRWRSVYMGRKMHSLWTFHIYLTQLTCTDNKTAQASTAKEMPSLYTGG